MNFLYLSHYVERDGDAYDVLIEFKVTSYAPGCPARINWDENDHPAEAAEYEFEIVSICLEWSPHKDAPLTEAEFATVRAWFFANHGRACEVADEDYYDGPDPDEMRERSRDDREFAP